MKKVQFWIAYGSPYTYLSAARIGKLAAAAGVPVEWRPFHLQTIFNEQGRPEGPFLPHPAKLQYMWRDLERRAARFGIPFRRPSRYPAKSLTAARVATLAAGERWCEPFTQHVLALHWTQDIGVDTERNLTTALQALGRNPADVLAAAEAADNIDALRTQTEIAKSLGIFGAPSFVVDGQLFWGDDRLEDALEWAQAH